MSRFIVGSSFVLMCVVIVGAQPPQAPAPRRIPVEEWVKQLGSDDARERDTAEKSLSVLAVDPPSELLAATNSADRDLRAAAVRVTEAMQWNLVARKLPRGVRFAEQGRVDLFVAATAAWKLKADDERLWVPAQDLGRRLIKEGDMVREYKPNNCPSAYADYATYIRLHKPRSTRLDDRYLRPDPQELTPPVLFVNEQIQSEGVLCPTGFLNTLIVSRNNVRTMLGIQHSVLFVNGDVTTERSVTSSVIVCDGDFTISDPQSGLWCVLVIARGNITVEGDSSRSVLIAGGKVKGKGTGYTRDLYVCHNTHNEPNPLGFVTFFELHRVGIEAKAADKVVSITAIKAGSAAALAGFKAGDVVVAVGDKKPADVEALRRALRGALALGDAAVTVTRDGKPVQIKLALPE